VFPAGMTLRNRNRLEHKLWYISTRCIFINKGRTGHREELFLLEENAPGRFTRIV